MGVGHGYSVGTGGHDFFMSVLFFLIRVVKGFLASVSVFAG